ncbi:ankyrin repeat domain-containing protein [Aspergillus neoniger CBS 115656]|uniref:Uncharacterized protein n=1 Tax=Aspergillus neoniger (strain CBS 115656) TaxID=1448310 RepID=A0A318Z4K5_ASPNB|nr:hypothetical protein BO87DRAFT_442907 [Aspergillus neoniger CBS 115656]PYH38640.1 hypothetical protein BO87DRAFT_442907 [Aspergillus neoniger CBS 115656]
MRRAKLLLQSCTDINEEKGFFSNALAAAIASEKLSIVQLVLDAGANIKLRGRYGFPLRAAVIINNFEITKCLLEKGTDPNEEDHELGDALQAAASRGNIEIMSLLLAYKADVQGLVGDTTVLWELRCTLGIRAYRNESAKTSVCRLLIKVKIKVVNGQGRLDAFYPDK